MTEPSFDGDRWSNADADRVEIVEHDSRWTEEFAVEASRLRKVLTGIVTPRIEHVGSTAIPGISAKPIVDILLVLPPEADWSAIVDPLESIDYVYWADNPRPDRMFFVKGMPPHGTGRTHHVHVRKPPEVHAMLLFRDHLIAHPEAASRYEALKLELAIRHPTDREAYTRGKDAFIEEMLAEARG